jgi:hypothetical protein
MRGFPLEPWTQCTGRSRQSGERCKRSSTPFSQPPRCILHGSNLPAARAKARERMEAYANGMIETLDPPWVRREKVQAWERAEERYQRRLMKKKGTLADWEQGQADEKARHAADVKRRAREREDAKQQYREARYGQPQRPAQPEPRPSTGTVEVGSAIGYDLGGDWDV